ncbi:hypothetical protein [Pseudomonas sp. NFX224]|uniref:hypothetical protein n=1 Tax=Pseudomonas sp. NFX224 TaxID=3402862 RepID=UPI003AFB0734
MEGPERLITELVLKASLAIGTIVLILAVRFLSRRHPGDVRTLWYFFSLSHVISLILFLWGLSSRAFENESYVGPVGSFLKLLLDETENLEFNLLLMSSVVAIIVLPQLLSYILSAVSGCASEFWLFRAVIPFLVWGLIKFFAISAGIWFTFAVSDYCLGIYLGRKGMGIPFAFENLAISFSILVIYRSSERVATFVVQRCPEGLKQTAQRIHIWASRANKKVGKVEQKGKV